LNVFLQVNVGGSKKSMDKMIKDISDKLKRQEETIKRIESKLDMRICSVRKRKMDDKVDEIEEEYVARRTAESIIYKRTLDELHSDESFIESWIKILLLYNNLF